VHDADADEHVAHGPVTESERAAAVARDDAAKRGAFRKRRVQREKLIMCA